MVAFADANQSHVVIKQQPLTEALTEFAEKTGIQLVYSSKLTAGFRTNGAEGKTHQDVLGQLLAGTGLIHEHLNNNTITLVEQNKTKTVVGLGNESVPGDDIEGKVMKKSFFSRLVSGIAIGLVTGGVAGAETSDNSSLEEILVTAYKREQSFTDVPGSIVAVGSERLNDNGINAMTDLYQIVPSLNFHESSSPTGDHLRIRGVGNTGTAGLETGVSILIDGMVTGSTAPRVDQVYDVKRVEVLRGPQGTLFGKNASAGIIHVITENPTQEYEGYTHIEYGSGDWGDQDLSEVNAKFGFGGPINDNLGFRLAGFTRQQDGGYMFDVVTDDHINSTDVTAVRGKLQYEEGNFLARLSVSVSDEDRQCCMRTFRTVEAPFGGLTSGYLLPELEAQGITPSADNRVISADGDPVAEADSKTTLVIGDLEWEFDNGMILKSITGYNRWDFQHSDDADTISVNLANINIFAEDLRVVSEEIQLLSPESEKYDYILGLYYWDLKNDGERRLKGWAPLYGNERDNSRLYTVNSRNIAAFGHFNYSFNDKWRGFAGARVLRDEIEHKAITVDNMGNGAGPVIAPGLVANNDNEDDNWAGTLGLQFYPSGEEGGMLFASATRGYKGPGINIGDGNPGFSTDPSLHGVALLDPEKVMNFELGYKQSFPDVKNALVSLSLFRTTFEDYQANIWNAATSSTLVQNAAELRTQGVELEVSANPWRGGDVWIGISYTDAFYKSYPDAQCTAVQNFNRPDPGEPCLQDLSGKDVAETPEWEFHMTARHNFMIAGKYPASISTDINWFDEITWGTDLDPHTKADAYWLVNMKASVHFDDNWEGFVFGRNVLDETYPTRVLDAVLFSPGAYSQYMAPGRMVGAGVRWTMN